MRSLSFVFSRTWALAASIPFFLVLFFLSTADAMMSYLAPVTMETNLGSPALMGAIMSFSSIVGLSSDFLLSGILRRTPVVRILVWAIAISVIFPLIFLFFPAHVMTYLFAMGIWGIYYELNVFFQYEYTTKFVSRAHYASTWGVIDIVHALAYVLGPLLVTTLEEISVRTALYAVLIPLAIAGVLTLVFPKKQHTSDAPKRKKYAHFSLRFEWRIWRVLFATIWPVYFFVFFIFLLDAAFWTVGILLAEEMQHIHPLGKFFVTLYTLPGLFAGVFAGILAKPLGKKRIAFLAASIGGIILFFTHWIFSFWPVLIGVFFASLFFALARPEIFAVMEDYIGRTPEFAGEFIGLQGSSASLAYVIGPALAGYAATYLPYNQVIALIGGSFALFSLFLLWFVPRKIHIPQSRLRLEQKHFRRK